MGVNVARYTVALVREKATRYDFENKNFSSPDKIAELMGTMLDVDNLSEEYMYLIALDAKNKIIGISEISHGSVTASIVHPREVFKRAIGMNAYSIILCHNHPSGESSPSNEDINVTKRLIESGNILGVPVIDHIVLGHFGNYTSFKANGHI